MTDSDFALTRRSAHVRDQLRLSCKPARSLPARNR